VYRGLILGWLHEHQREMSGIPNYHARVVPLDGSVDAINVAIIDEKAVLILLTSEGSFMSGHRLDASESVSSFHDYYSSWWASAEPSTRSYGESTIRQEQRYERRDDRRSCSTEAAVGQPGSNLISATMYVLFTPSGRDHLPGRCRPGWRTRRPETHPGRSASGQAVCSACA
jgi:hypothetical protein